MRGVRAGVIALGLALGLVLLAMPSVAKADKLNYEDILGKWCGETTNYVFSRASLIVTWHDSNDRRVLRIRRYEFSDDWINVIYRDDGNTVFSEFSADGRRMAQQANTHGDKGPRRPYRRC